MKKVIVILLFIVCSLLLITQSACGCSSCSGYDSSIPSAAHTLPDIQITVNEGNPVYIYAGDKLDYTAINLKVRLINGSFNYSGGNKLYTYDTYDQTLGTITPAEGTVLTEGKLTIKVYWKGAEISRTHDITVRPASEKESKDTALPPSSETSSLQSSQSGSEKTSSSASSTRSEASSIVSSAPASSAISSAAGSSASTSSIASLPSSSPSSSPSSAPESSEESSAPESDPEETTYTRAIQVTPFDNGSVSMVELRVDSLEAGETLYAFVCDAKFTFSSPQAIYEAYKSGENLKAKTSERGPKEDFNVIMMIQGGDPPANNSWYVVVRDDGAINTNYWKHDFKM